MWARVDGLRALELGMPGELRERLNRLVVTGVKQATAGLVDLDYRAESEELEHIGERLVLIDSAGAPLTTVEVTAIEVVPFEDVTWEFAQAEGEGFRSIAHWRAVHRAYWAKLGHQVDGSAEICCLQFQMVDGAPTTLANRP